MRNLISKLKFYCGFDKEKEIITTFELGDYLKNGKIPTPIYRDFSIPFRKIRFMVGSGQGSYITSVGRNERVFDNGHLVKAKTLFSKKKKF